MTSMRVHRPDRRVLLAWIGALGSFGLAACSRNETTGRAQLVLVSDDMLQAMGEKAWADALAELPRDRDGALNRRLARIGEAVGKAAAVPGQRWEFVVFDSPQINAFVLPGGKVGVYRGLMDFVGSDAELAAVVAHEAAHVIARHAAERMSQQFAVEAGVRLAALAFGEELGAYADEAAAALGAGLVYGVILPYSRAHELEADRIGVDLMRQGGFEAAAAVTFWERMVARSGGEGEALAWLSTHPAPAERLDALRRLAA